MLVKVESLELGLELYHAGLLRWYDGDSWSLDNAYGEPRCDNEDCMYVNLED